MLKEENQYLAFNIDQDISLCIPSVKSAGKTTFTYSAIKIWNELPKEHKFKGAVKSYLFDKMQHSDVRIFVF